MFDAFLTTTMFKKQISQKSKNIVRRKTKKYEKFDPYHKCPLHTAIQNYDIETTRRLCHSGSHVNDRAKDWCGTTPIFVAIERMTEQVGDAFLESVLLGGADPTMTLLSGVSPLSRAIEMRNVRAIHMLYKYNHFLHDKYTLIDACYTLDPAVLAAVIQHLPTEYMKSFGNSAFMCVVNQAFPTCKYNSGFAFNWDSYEDRIRIMSILNCLKILYTVGKVSPCLYSSRFSGPLQNHPFVNNFAKHCKEGGAVSATLLSYDKIWS